MRKRVLWIVLAVCLAVLLIPRWKGAGELPLFYRLQTARMLHIAQSTLPDGSVDERESRLIALGLPVLDSDARYPAYLANAQDFTAFCQGTQRSAAALRCMEGGQIRQLLFLRQGKDVWFYITEPDPVDGGRITERLPVYDMTLSDRGIFYYRCYPEGDPHYIDYNEIRLEAVNRKDYDLLKTYIFPVGYQMVNLFLTDWQEGDWGCVSLTDTLEFFYTMETGEALPWERWEGTTSKIFVPENIFEETLLSRFAITAQQLRELCDYQPETGCYPWRPVHGDQLTTWGYPMCQPELASCRVNPNGTKTLEIRVFSPDKRGALLFVHEVTIRDLDKGFQYVGNRVTQIGGFGLPVTLPRFQLDNP